MACEKRKILNNLLRQWQPGSIAVSSWLNEQGVYQQLVHEYEKNGWIQRIGRGAYIRAGDSVEWGSALHTIQNQLSLPVHVSAKSALQLQGYAHFLQMGGNPAIWLFGLPGTRLPGWFEQYNWGVDFFYITTNLFLGKKETGLTQKEQRGFSVNISSPERAIMEVLYLVPKQESFEEANLLMEGLSTLRPSLLQELLEQCNSVKVKRLFLYLAEKSGHSWINRLNIDGVNLGKGKRVIVKGGVFNSKYGITVPESDLENSERVDQL